VVMLEPCKSQIFHLICSRIFAAGKAIIYGVGQRRSQKSKTKFKRSRDNQFSRAWRRTARRKSEHTSGTMGVFSLRGHAVDGLALDEKLDERYSTGVYTVEKCLVIVGFEYDAVLE